MKTHFRFLVSLVCLLFFSISLSAQIPNLISFQGILTDSEGLNLPDGFYQIDFAIFDAPSEGNLLWSESQSVSTESGLANVMLGANNPLELPFDKMYFVEMTVSGETLSPRVPMTASPYSLNAANVTLKDLNLNNDNIGGGSISNSANSRVNIYSNNSAFDSPSWIELWGENVGDGFDRAGELTLSGRYISFWVKSGSEAFGMPQMHLTEEGRLGIGIWPGYLMHARGSDTTEAVLLLEPAKWDSNEDLAEIWLGSIESRIVSRFGSQLYFYDNEGYFFEGGPADFLGTINANNGLNINGLLEASGSQGNFRVHPFFESGNGTTLLGAFTGFNGNGPQLRFETVGSESNFYDIGMNGNKEFVIEYFDDPKFIVRQDGAQLFGNLNLTGAVIDGSSRAFKSNISNLSSSEAMEAIMALQPVTYHYKAEKEQDLHVGFIAEDVPELLSIPSRQGISSMDVTAALTKVVQEQQKMIETLQQELALLKNEIKTIRNEKE